MNHYESPRLVSEYLFFHYASFNETAGGLPVPEIAWGFAQRVVRDLIDLKSHPSSALDIGCAVGGSSFELARHVSSVLGIDYSHAFINAADTLKKNSCIAGEVALEGHRMQSFEVKIPSDIDRSRVSFETGDAGALRTDIGSYDVVLAANLLCRLPNPHAFLQRLPELVKPGGQLLLATPFSWLSEFTPESKWIGGHSESLSSLEALTEILTPHFTNEFTTNLPFLIREHSRKFQYGISLGTRWRRR